MKTIRILFVSFLFLAIVWWSFGITTSIHMAGPMNELLAGILLFIVLVANTGAVIMDFSKNDYGTLPNRIIFASIGVLVLFLGSPLLINVFNNINNFK